MQARLKFVIALEMDNFLTPKLMHISQIHSMSKEGAHSQVEAYISPPYANKQLPINQ